MASSSVRDETGATAFNLKKRIGPTLTATDAATASKRQAAEAVASARNRLEEAYVHSALETFTSRRKNLPYDPPAESVAGPPLPFAPFTDSKVAYAGRMRTALSEWEAKWAAPVDYDGSSSAGADTVRTLGGDSDGLGGRPPSARVAFIPATTASAPPPPTPPLELRLLSAPPGTGPWTPIGGTLSVHAGGPYAAPQAAFFRTAPRPLDDVIGIAPRHPAAESLYRPVVRPTPAWAPVGRWWPTLSVPGPGTAHLLASGDHRDAAVYSGPGALQLTTSRLMTPGAPPPAEDAVNDYRVRLPARRYDDTVYEEDASRANPGVNRGVGATAESLRYGPSGESAWVACTVVADRPGTELEPPWTPMEGATPLLRITWCDTGASKWVSRLAVRFPGDSAPLLAARRAAATRAQRAEEDALFVALRTAAMPRTASRPMPPRLAAAILSRLGTMKTWDVTVPGSRRRAAATSAAGAYVEAMQADFVYVMKSLALARAARIEASRVGDVANRQHDEAVAAEADTLRLSPSLASPHLPLPPAPPTASGGTLSTAAAAWEAAAAADASPGGVPEGGTCGRLPIESLGASRFRARRSSLALVLVVTNPYALAALQRARQYMLQIEAMRVFDTRPGGALSGPSALSASSFATRQLGALDAACDGIMHRVFGNIETLCVDAIEAEARDYAPRPPDALEWGRVVRLINVMAWCALRSMLASSLAEYHRLFAVYHAPLQLRRDGPLSHAEVQLLRIAARSAPKEEAMGAPPLAGVPTGDAAAAVDAGGESDLPASMWTLPVPRLAVYWATPAPLFDMDVSVVESGALLGMRGRGSQAGTSGAGSLLSSAQPTPRGGGSAAPGGPSPSPSPSISTAAALVAEGALGRPATGGRAGRGRPGSSALEGDAGVLKDIVPDLLPSPGDCKKLIEAPIHAAVDALAQLPSFELVYPERVAAVASREPPTDSAAEVATALALVADVGTDSATVPDLLVTWTKAFSERLADPPVAFGDVGRKLAEWERLILQHQAEENEILAALPAAPLLLGLYRVSLAALRSSLAERARTYAAMLLHAIAAEMAAVSAKMAAEAEPVLLPLMRGPETLEEVYACKILLAQVPATMRRLEGRMAFLDACAAVLERCHAPLADDQAAAFFTVKSMLSQVAAVQAARRAELPAEEAKYTAQLVGERLSYTARVDALASSLVSYQAESLAALEATPLGEDVPAESLALRGAALTGDVRGAEVERSRLQRCEDLIGLDPRTDYAALQEVAAELAPYADLWSVAAEYGRKYTAWTWGPVTAFAADDVAEAVPAWLRLIARSLDRLQGGMLEYARELDAKIEEYAHFLPLLHALQSRDLRDRHWAAITPLLALQADEMSREDVTLAHLVAHEVDDHTEAIVRQAELAGQEAVVERALARLSAEWNAHVVELDAHEGTGTAVFTNLELLLELLDDAHLRLQQLQASPHVGPHLTDAQYLEKALGSVKEVLECLHEAQTRWLYLHPLFGATGSAASQMASESKRFHGIDETWRGALALVARMSKPRIMDITFQRGLVLAVQDAASGLQSIVKGMHTWLEAKRAALPLFALVSNAELLEMLIHEAEPRRLASYLPPLLGGIDGLVLGAPTGWEDVWAPGAPSAAAADPGAASQPMMPLALAGSKLARLAKRRPSFGGGSPDIGDLLRTGQMGVDAPDRPSDPPNLHTSSLRAVRCASGESLALARPVFLFQVSAGVRSKQRLVPKPLEAWLAELAREMRESLQERAADALRQHYEERATLLDWVMPRPTAAAAADGAPGHGKSGASAAALGLGGGPESAVAAALACAPHPPQAVVVAARVLWAREAADALRVLGEMPRALHSCSERFGADLAVWARAASCAGGVSRPGSPRASTPPLSSASRVALHALLLAGCSHRDVLDSLLASEVTGPLDFEWLQHLRYDISGGECQLHFPDATVLKYGFEWHAAGARLGAVVTPACERQLAALHHTVRCGGAALVAGPAQGGKSAAVESLARWVGRRVHTASAAGGLDASTLGRLFRGMVQGGLWLCFEAVDALPRPALALLTSHLLALQTAIRLRHSSLSLDGGAAAAGTQPTGAPPGAFVPISPGYAVFGTVITAGPGAAVPRRAMPESTAQLFRAVHVTPPPLGAALAALLPACGFSDASLASAAAACLTACEALLPGDGSSTTRPLGLQIARAVVHRARRRLVAATAAAGAAAAAAAVAALAAASSPIPASGGQSSTAVSSAVSSPTAGGGSERHSLLKSAMPPGMPLLTLPSSDSSRPSLVAGIAVAATAATAEAVAAAAAAAADEPRCLAAAFRAVLDPSLDDNGRTSLGELLRKHFGDVGGDDPLDGLAPPLSILLPAPLTARGGVLDDPDRGSDAGVSDHGDADDVAQNQGGAGGADSPAAAATAAALTSRLRAELLTAASGDVGTTPSAKTESSALLLHDCLVAHTAVLVVGGAGAGKSTAIALLASALRRAGAPPVEDQHPLHASAGNAPPAHSPPHRYASSLPSPGGVPSPAAVAPPPPPPDMGWGSPELRICTAPRLPEGPQRLATPQVKRPRRATGAGVASVEMASRRSTIGPAADNPGAAVIVRRIFPKSLDAGRLYGAAASSASGEPLDGVLTAALRAALAEAAAGARSWLVLDGPVDEGWAEGLHALLDAPECLPLPSGESLRLLPGVKLILEADTLAGGCPATLARCGLLHVSQDPQAWQDLATSWIAGLPRWLRHYSNKLEVLVAWLLVPALDFAESRRDAFVPAGPGWATWIVTNMLRLLGSHFAELRATLPPMEGEEEEASRPLDPPEFHSRLECLFLFCLVWTVGAGIDPDYRPAFSDLMQELCIQEHDYTLFNFDPAIETVVGETFTMRISEPLPVGGSVFGVYFRFDKPAWVPWEQSLPPFVVSDAAAFGELLVPTVDTAPLLHVLTRLVAGGTTHVLVAGPADSGKTSTIHAVLQAYAATHGLGTGGVPNARGGDSPTPTLHGASSVGNVAASVGGAVTSTQAPTAAEPLFYHRTMQLSALTSASDAQMALETGLRRHKKGVQGPPLGSRCTFFVDDLAAAPVRPGDGAPPVGELLRCFLDQGGWVDLGSTSFLECVGLQFLLALTTSTNDRVGRYPSSSPTGRLRLVRHTHLATSPALSDASIRAVFGVIAASILDKASPEAKAMGPTLVTASLDLLRGLQHALPTSPETPQLVYGLRDLARLWEGMRCAAPRCTDAKGPLALLFRNESLRAFSDRLPSPKLRAACRRVMDDVCVDAGLLEVDADEVAIRPPTDVDGSLGSSSFMGMLSRHSTSGIVPTVGGDVNERPATRRGSVLLEALYAEASRDPGGSTTGRRLSVAGSGSSRRGSGAPVGDSREMSVEELEAEAESAPIYCTFGWTVDGPYEDAPDLAVLATACASYVEERNADAPQSPLFLAPFKAALESLARTVRALRLDAGHALLLGPPGTGKRTVAKLAAYLAGFELIELKGVPSAGVTPSDRYWRPDLKHALQMAGMLRKRVALLLHDWGQAPEGLVDDLAHLMDSGKVPGLYSNDEIKVLAAEIDNSAAGGAPGSSAAGNRGSQRFGDADGASTGKSPRMAASIMLRREARGAEPATRQRRLYELFVHRCRQNLRIVVCMPATAQHSTLGARLPLDGAPKPGPADAYRDLLSSRLALFPALLRRSTAIFFDEWNARARIVLAQHTWTEAQLVLSAEDSASQLQQQAAAAAAAGITPRLPTAAAMSASRRPSMAPATAGGGATGTETTAALAAAKLALAGLGDDDAGLSWAGNSNHGTAAPRTLVGGSRGGPSETGSRVGSRRSDPPSARPDGSRRKVGMHPEQLGPAAAVASAIHAISVEESAAESGCYVACSDYVELVALTARTYAINAAATEAERHGYVSAGLQLETLLDGIKSRRKELEEMSPKLERLVKEHEFVARKTDLKAELEVVRSRDVEMAAAAAARETERVRRLQARLDTDLAATLAGVRGASDAFQALSRKELAEFRGMVRAPESVRLVMEAVCVLLGFNPKELTEPGATQKDIERGYWALSRRLLAEGDFMASFVALAWDALPEDVLDRLHHYAFLPEFSPDAIQRHSRPASLLCSWVIALDKYYAEYRALEPKRVALKAAQAAAAHEENSLAVARGHLEEIRKGLQELQDELGAIASQRDRLRGMVESAPARIRRAIGLVSAIGNEATRWFKAATECGERAHWVLGDALLAAACVAYAGPLRAKQRESRLHSWKSALKAHGLTFNPMWKLHEVLGAGADPATKSAELPALYSSAAVIALRCRRTPLLVDPHNVAGRWLRDLFKDSRLVATPLEASHAGIFDDGTAVDLGQQLTMCKEFGLPVILEGLDDELMAIEAHGHGGGPVPRRAPFPAVVDDLLHARMIGRIGPGKRDAVRAPLGLDDAADVSLGVAAGLSASSPPGFELFVVSKHGPEFMGEITSRTTVVNFAAGEAETVDEFVMAALRKDQPELQDEVMSLSRNHDAAAAELRGAERALLALMAKSTNADDFLGEDILINALRRLRETAASPYLKPAPMHAASAALSKIRDVYQKSLQAPVAQLQRFQASFPSVHPFYRPPHFVLRRAFTAALAERHPEGLLLPERLDRLRAGLSRRALVLLFVGLFAHDRQPAAAALVTQHLLVASRGVDPRELHYFLTGGQLLTAHGLPAKDYVPTSFVMPEWMPAATRTLIYKLSQLPAYATLPEELSAFPARWEEYLMRPPGVDEATPPGMMIHDASDEPPGWAQSPSTHGADFGTPADAVHAAGDTGTALAGVTEEDEETQAEEDVPAEGGDAQTAEAAGVSDDAPPQTPAAGGGPATGEAHGAGDGRDAAAGAAPPVNRSVSGAHTFSTVPGMALSQRRTSIGGGWLRSSAVPWSDKLSPFHKLLLLSALKPHGLLTELQYQVGVHLDGETLRVVRSPVELADMQAAMELSVAEHPVALLLPEEGSFDAHPKVVALAGRMARMLFTADLAREPTEAAERLVAKYHRAGRWVLLQNCHMTPAWAPRLKGLIEGLASSAPHPDFRLLLTFRPDASLLRPSVFKHCLKVALQPGRSVGIVLEHALGVVTADERANNPNRPRRVSPRATSLLACMALLHEGLAQGRSGPPVWGQVDLELATAATVALLEDGGLEAGPAPSDPSPPPRLPLQAASPTLRKRAAHVLSQIVYGPLVADASQRAKLATLATALLDLAGPPLVDALPLVVGLVMGPQADPQSQLQAMLAAGKGATLQAQALEAIAAADPENQPVDDRESNLRRVLGLLVSNK